MLKKINTSLAHSYAIWGKLVPSGFGYEMYFFFCAKKWRGEAFPLMAHCCAILGWRGPSGFPFEMFFLFCAEGGGRINMLSLTQNFG